MPEFWQFPTVSMGLGPINAIYQAQSNKYLTNRGIKDASDQHVWAFLGDGEMDEVESRGQLQVAANEGLDNLTFVINCNLQRLDGPVRGNGKIIQELESFFRGAGWNVIKVVWGREWDELLAKRHRRRARAPHEHHPGRRLPDLQGRERRLRPRELLRPRPERTAKLVKDYTDDQIWGTSSAAATTTARSTRRSRPPPSTRASRPSSSRRRSRATASVTSFEGRNATHQMKKMTLDNLKHVPRRDAHPDHATRSSRRTRTCRRTTTPASDDEAIQYLQERRRALGGYLPGAPHASTRQITLPDDSRVRARRRRAPARRRSPRRWRSSGC